MVGHFILNIATVIQILKNDDNHAKFIQFTMIFVSPRFAFANHVLY